MRGFENPHAPEPFPSREPFSHRISKLRIQMDDSQGQLGAPVEPTLYSNTYNLEFSLLYLPDLLRLLIGLEISSPASS